MDAIPSLEHRRGAGFTLIEVVVTLAVLALLSGLAIPAFNDLIARQQAYAAASTLFADLGGARSEAVRGAQQVVLCASRDGRQCGDHPWHQGWLIAADENRDRLITPEETPLIVRAAAAARILIHWRNDNIPITFLPSGLTPAINGTFLICHAGVPLYAIHLHWTGRARLSGAGDINRPCPPTRFGEEE